MDLDTLYKLVMRQLAIIIAALFLLMNPGCSTELSRFNFDYTDGDKPWLTHISSEVNTTFEAALSENPYLRRLVCAGDSTDTGKNPFKQIPPVCMEGKGAKMVVPLFHPARSHLVFFSPQEGGLFEQKHMTGRHPTHYYDQSKLGTKYFLIPFDDYEIPTFHPLESQIYLPIWKRVFQATNDMRDEYFNAHIRVVSVTVKQYEYRGRQERRFTVVYHYYVDWARIKLFDSFTIGSAETGLYEPSDSVELADSLRALEENLMHAKRSQRTYINRIESTANIASKDDIVQAVSEASPLLGFDVNRHLKLNVQGQLVLRLHGTVDEPANKCLRATVMLKDASVSELQDVPCRIY